jgi:AraC-like DNA-binding protein
MSTDMSSDNTVLRHLPDQRNPAIYTNVPTRFRWIDQGLLWPDDPCNFVAHFQGCDFYIPEHLGLLSVMCAFGGQETYDVGNDQIAVRDSAYLILNEGQNYASFIHSRNPVESLAVFFNPLFAADVLRSMIVAEDHLLDSPQGAVQPLAFFQQLYWEDESVSGLLNRLRVAAGTGHASHGWLEEQFHYVLHGMIQAHRTVRSDVDRLTSARPATRVELYRRLHRARDFMDSHLEKSLSLPEIAEAAYFSPHHFLRTFKQAFHETPHQYLTRRRIEWARFLLTRTTMSVTEVCGAVGFESLGSFSWLFRQRVGASPEAFRRSSAA